MHPCQAELVQTSTSGNTQLLLGSALLALRFRVCHRKVYSSENMPIVMSLRVLVTPTWWYHIQKGVDSKRCTKPLFSLLIAKSEVEYRPIPIGASRWFHALKYSCFSYLIINIISIILNSIAAVIQNWKVWQSSSRWLTLNFITCDILAFIYLFIDLKV